MQGSFRDLAINTKGDALQQRRANGWTEPNGRSTSPPVNNYSTFFGADAVRAKTVKQWLRDPLGSDLCCLLRAVCL